jgi:hypothetical protein
LSQKSHLCSAANTATAAVAKCLRNLTAAQIMTLQGTASASGPSVAGLSAWIAHGQIDLKARSPVLFSPRDFLISFGAKRSDFEAKCLICILNIQLHKLLNGVLVRTLLNAEMNVNNIIQLNPSDITTASVPNPGSCDEQKLHNGQPFSLDLNGQYRIIDLVFSGDTRATAPWFSDITAVSLANGTGLKDDLTPDDNPPPTISTGANTVNIMRMVNIRYPRHGYLLLPSLSNL